MDNRRLIPCIVGLAALVLQPATARAAIVTYVTTGRVTQIQDPLGLLEFVELGDIITYRSTFDTETPDHNPVLTIGSYQGSSSSVQVGQAFFAAQPPGMAIQHPLDLVTLSSNVAVTHAGLEHQGFVMMRLNDQPRSHALEGTRLPTRPYDVSLFASGYHQIVFQATPQIPGGYPIDLWISATVDSFTITPEPTALVLAAAGGLVLIRKRSRALTGESAQTRPPAAQFCIVETHQEVR